MFERGVWIIPNVKARLCSLSQFFSISFSYICLLEREPDVWRFFFSLSGECWGKKTRSILIYFTHSLINPIRHFTLSPFVYWVFTPLLLLRVWPDERSPKLKQKVGQSLYNRQNIHLKGHFIGQSTCNYIRLNQRIFKCDFNFFTWLKRQEIQFLKVTKKVA